MRDTKVKMCVWVDADTTQSMDNLCGFGRPHKSRADFIRLAIQHELDLYEAKDLDETIEREVDKNGEPVGPWTDPEDLV